MSGIAGMFGLGGNDNNASFQAKAAPITQPFNMGQVDNAYNNTQSGLGMQQAFINALQGQNGIQNQSAVFNQQQGLANQLQGVANGTGPNPAQMMLNQATGQNVAAQAALMAGQRGANANVGLMARQIAQQGANTQQQAAGQAATMGAEQQLGAMQALGNQQANMANVAGSQVGQQGQALGNYNQFALGQQQNLLNSVAAFNNAQVGMQSNMNNANEGISQINANNQQGMLGKAMGNLPIVGKLFAEGGEVPSLGDHLSNYYKGGMADYKSGGKVPGKAPMAGNNRKNDTVPAMLSPGEVVIPRSVMQSKDPAANAAKFVQAVMAKHGMKKNG